jgi:hypothetical protein
MQDPYFDHVTDVDSLDPDTDDINHDEDNMDEIEDNEGTIESTDGNGPGIVLIEPEYIEVDNWGVPLPTAMNFNSPIDEDSVIGEPLEDMENWHQQSYPDTCAVVSQEFILDELTGQDFTEEQLREEAIEHGLYSAGGTPPDAVGGLLELHGIDVEREYGASLDDLKAELDAGHKVIVGVDADEIWHPEQDGDTLLTDAGMLPGSDVNHAVQVIGVDLANHRVIFNDPGTPDGRGLMVPADQFMNSWADGDNFMVHTTGSSVVLAQGDEHSANNNQLLGRWEKGDSGYWYEYDPDGHYTGNYHS